MCGQNIHPLNILEYFVDYNFVNQNTHILNILETVLFRLSINILTTTYVGINIVHGN
jgi:hypothetical protein